MQLLMDGTMLANEDPPAPFPLPIHFCFSFYSTVGGEARTRAMCFQEEFESLQL